MDPVRKFDGQPLSMLPTTILRFRNGDLGCDDVAPDTPMLFPCLDMAEAHMKLSKKKGVHAQVIGTQAIIRLVKSIPIIQQVLFIADMGELHSHAGKFQREYYRAYMNRDAFLSTMEKILDKGE